jgi:uncharacterized protein (UPF0332 family)
MIRGDEFLKLAENYVTERSEAAWRSAVSRAYYAAFHVARDFVISLGFVTPRSEIAHAYLWRRLGNCGLSSLALAGSRLNQLRGERNRADYDLNDDLTQKDAKAAVKSAAMVIAALQAVLPDDRLLITEAMKTYERDVLRESTWRNRPR